VTWHLAPGRLAALLVVLAVLASGCTGVDDNGPGSTPSESASPTPSPVSSAGSPAVPRGLARFYHQKLQWQECRGGFTCARLRVPLDYAKPGGRTIEVAVLKAKARDSGERLGSIVYDPGGPGVSGMDYVTNPSALFGPAVLDHYDVVGLDPRGVGESDPVDCLSDTALDRVLTYDPDPDTPAEVHRSDALLKGFGRGCVARSGELAGHISTLEVAKDLDVLRAAMRERKMTYFGASYGTAIGAEYADLFPKNVGRMVLDGALDPRSSTLDINLTQAHGFETALRSYVGACVSRGGCFLGSTVDEGTHRVKQLLDQVEKTPLPAGHGRRLDVGNAVYGINYPLYNKAAWGVLDEALKRAFGGDGSLLMAMADAYLHRRADGTYESNAFEAFYDITCLDHDDAIPSADLAKYRARFDKASPTFGRSVLYATSWCENWPVHTGNKGKRVHATGAAPILVIGTTRDPATPLVWAKALAKQLDNAVLVTRDGDGHTGYRQGSQCTDTAVEAYLVSGTVPKHDVRCE
jgi:pimeloyl-ACP methyl ester carboxylesterase